MKYFEVPPLPYSYDFLEPVIDCTSLEVQYEKFHKAYTNKLNHALEHHPDLRYGHIDCLLGALSHVPKEIRQDVRQYGGAYKNYNLFWDILTKPNTSKYEGPIAEAINKTFGSYEAFQTALTEAAMAHFGSGWAWLVINPNNTLAITTTNNEDNPIMEMQTAILGINLWEHAYYGLYQDRRLEYIRNFFTIINWDKVNQLYDTTLKNPTRFGHE